MFVLANTQKKDFHSVKKHKSSSYFCHSCLLPTHLRHNRSPGIAAIFLVFLPSLLSASRPSNHTNPKEPPFQGDAEEVNVGKDNRKRIKTFYMMPCAKYEHVESFLGTSINDVLKNFGFFAPLSAFESDLYHKIHATSLTTSAFS